MEQVFQHIADLGFPIVLSLYLLLRLEGKIEALTLSIEDLTKTLKA